MKISKILIAGFLALFATLANASTVFEPTDGDVNFIFPTLGGYDLYIFDDSVSVGSMTAATGLLVSVPEAITFTSAPDATGSNGTLSLSGDTKFVLGITDGVSWMTDNGGYIDLGASSYLVSFDGAKSVLTVDVAVVPVPAAAWLFASGLLGLVGIARRRT